MLRKKKIRCIKDVKGLTLGKVYNLIGCAGEYVQLKDDAGNFIVVSEEHFSIV